jgi:dolichol-phosphate mannosyltransferase
MDLSLVLTCCNEERVLAKSVEEVLRVLDFTRMSYEIIFVDDASRDGTPEAIRRIIEANPRVPMRALHHGRNTGWGGAVADGIREATGDIVGFLDVDLEVHPRYIPACCLAIRQGAQVAVGVRVFKFVARGLWRRFLTAAHGALVRLVLPVSGPENTSSGCKCFRRTDILPILDRVEDTGWFWDVEMMVQCRLAGLSVAMVPCVYVRDPAKPSAVRVFRDGFASVRKLLAFRGRLRRAGLLRGGRAAT